MQNKYFIFWIIILIVSYIIIINFTAKLCTISLKQTNKTIEEGGVQKIGMGDSVSISVKRNRIYGIIYENNGNAQLYLLGLIPLPLKSNNIGFLKFHFIFLVVLIIMIFTKDWKNYAKTNL